MSKWLQYSILQSQDHSQAPKRKFIIINLVMQAYYNTALILSLYFYDNDIYNNNNLR